MNSEMTLVEFLAARLDEDEATAQACCRPRQPVEGGEVWFVEDYVPSEPDAVPSGAWVVTGPEGEQGVGLMSSDARAQHIARHDPARVLREVEAGRQALGHYERVRVHARTRAGVDYELALGAVEKQLMYRALAYSDHPAYQEAWKP